MRDPARNLPLDDALDSLDSTPSRSSVVLRLVQDTPPDTAEPDAPRLDVPNDAGAFLESSVAQDGGAEGMPVRRGSQHQYRAVLHEAIVRVADALDVNGVCDAKGRLRRSWITSLEGLIREARAIDELLDARTGRPAPRDGRPRAHQPPPAHAGEAPANPMPSPLERLPREVEAFFDRMDRLDDGA